MNKGQHTEYIASIDNAPSTRAAQLGALSPTHNIINAGSKYLQYTVHYTVSKYLQYTVHYTGSKYLQYTVHYTGSKYLQYTVHYTGSKYLKYTVYSNQIQIFPIYHILIPGPNIYSTPLVLVTTHV